MNNFQLNYSLTFFNFKYFIFRVKFPILKIQVIFCSNCVLTSDFVPNKMPILNENINTYF